MLIARAPMRVSYAGGGTDIEDYYREHGGLVVSAAIAKYLYVFISDTGQGALQVSSADYRSFLRYGPEAGPLGAGADLRHAEAAFEHLGVRRGYSVFMASEVPAGTGLGASSAVAVALVKGLTTLQGRPYSKAEIAEAACEIELGRLGMPIGRQDQYASAFGGLNAISFSAEGVQVQPLEVPLDVLRRLDACTMLFYTGMAHDSSRLLKEQQSRIRKGGAAALEALHSIKRAAEAAREALLAGEPDRLGPILDESWRAKKELNPAVTNPALDRAYTAARGAGAAGGKIAGAGDGGFLVLHCEPDCQERVTDVLHEAGLLRTDFSFDFGGARVLMNHAAG